MRQPDATAVLDARALQICRAIILDGHRIRLRVGHNGAVLVGERRLYLGNRLLNRDRQVQPGLQDGRRYRGRRELGAGGNERWRGLGKAGGRNEGAGEKSGDFHGECRDKTD